MTGYFFWKSDSTPESPEESKLSLNKKLYLQLRVRNLGIGFLDNPFHGNKMRNIVTDAMKLPVELDQFVAIDSFDLPIR